jgi:hypothetical protein
MDKYAVTLALDEVASDAFVLLILGLHESALFHVHLPPSLIGLITSLAVVDTLAVFLAI